MGQGGLPSDPWQASRPRGLSRRPHRGPTWLPGSPGGGGRRKEAHGYGSFCLHWRELREDPGNGLQGGEVVVPGSMQRLVAADVAMRKHLLAGGAHTAV